MTRRIALSTCVLTLLLLSVPSTALANAVAPPAVVIVVDNPPSDLHIAPVGRGGDLNDKLIVRQWEGYYAFYSLGDVDYDAAFDFHATASDLDFTFTLNRIVNVQSGFTKSNPDNPEYFSYYYLDLQTHECVLDNNPLRYLPATMLRVLLTLVIEGVFLWLFKFRRPLSWVFFLIVNLATQTALGFMLADWVTPFSSYPIIYLLILEGGVYLVELLVLVPLLAVSERRVKTAGGWESSSEPVYSRVLRAMAFVLLANTASLILGGFLLMSLPI